MVVEGKGCWKEDIEGRGGVLEVIQGMLGGCCCILSDFVGLFGGLGVGVGVVFDNLFGLFFFLKAFLENYFSVEVYFGIVSRMSSALWL